MWMRWTLDGSSWGRRGWIAAGAVVKGVGIAVELLLTAAADLVKDLGVRLVGLGAIVGRAFGGDRWENGEGFVVL